METPHLSKHQQKLLKEFLGFETNTVSIGIGPVVVITADGTAVPLEANTVRSIDSMKHGDDGSFAALTAEYFLSIGYRVIYLHRSDSLHFPFTKAFRDTLNISRANQMEFMEAIYLQDSTLRFRIQNSSKPSLTSELVGLESQIMRSIIRNSQHHEKPPQEQWKLLPVSYHTIHEYFSYLEYLFELSAEFGPQVMFYLTARVSPYYIPLKELATHKIQSDAAIELHLKRVSSPISEYRSKHGKYVFVVEINHDQLLESSSPSNSHHSRLPQSSIDHITSNLCHLSLNLGCGDALTALLVREKALTNLSYCEDDFTNHSGRKREQAAIPSSISPSSSTSLQFEVDSFPLSGKSVVDVDTIGQINDKIVQYYKEYAIKNFCCRFPNGQTMTISGGFAQILQPKTDSDLCRDIQYYQSLCRKHLLVSSITTTKQSTSSFPSDSNKVEESKKIFVHRLSFVAGMLTFATLACLQNYFLSTTAY